jgi:flagellar hook-length control protein FliK
MLAENGLSLGQADVSDRGVGEGNGHEGTDRQVSNHSSEESQEAGIDTDPQTARRVTTTNGLVDTFA